LKTWKIFDIDGYMCYFFNENKHNNNEN
jgi:hypothetical protein